MYPLGLMTMTLFRCNYDSLWAHGRVVHSILGSRGVVTAEKLVSHAKFGITGPEAWSVVSCGWWRYWYDRVSQVLAYQTGPRAKLESYRADGAGLLDNGTSERP